MTVYWQSKIAKAKIENNKALAEQFERQLQVHLSRKKHKKEFAFKEKINAMKGWTSRI